MHEHPLLVPTLSDQTASFGSTPLDRWALRRIQQTVASAPIRFVLWDGFELPATAGPPSRRSFSRTAARCSAGCGIPS